MLSWRRRPKLYLKVRCNYLRDNAVSEVMRRLAREASDTPLALATNRCGLSSASFKATVKDP
jgi:hypothetical protein